MGENIDMLPSDTNLKIKTGTAGYNNNILVSDGKFSLGKNEKVNALEPVTMESHKNSTTIESHKNSAHSTTVHGLSMKPTITHR